jgi:hypothetical protein
MTDLPAGVDQGALDAAATEPIEEANPVPAEPEVAEEQPPAAPAAAPVDYSGWLKADLVAEADSRGLDTSGTKDELVARLEASQ